MAMGSSGFFGRRERFMFGVVLGVVLYLLVESADASVVLMAKNVSFSFNDVEANFAPAIKSSGVSGILYVAEPHDACGPLIKANVDYPALPFALIMRGGCTFDEKVRHAQNAGFKAAIVYDNEDIGSLVSMSGTPGGIKILAIFVSKSSGETLMKYVGRSDVEIWIIPTPDDSAWSIMAISFISLLAMSAALATCFFVRRHRIRRVNPPRPSNVREFHGMSRRLVQAMPSLIFASVLEDNCTSVTCAICLEDYSIGEKLRILPCRHKFHAACVDSWLTTWRSFCPVCKRDAKTDTEDPPASETTPLLASSASLLSSSAALSSFRSSISVSISPAIQICPPPRHSPSPSQSRPISIGSHVSHSHRSFYNSPSIGRSSADLRNASLVSAASYLASPHSVGVHFSPSINSRYMSPYIPGSSNASPPSHYVGSTSRVLRHCNKSDSSLSAFNSTLSLPGC